VIGGFDQTCPWFVIGGFDQTCPWFVIGGFVVGVVRDRRDQTCP
jgi:F0F1-type ATP synthase assembly protein I